MFNGFNPEAVDFLWGIRLNNNREWFMEHKSQYVKTLYEPMKALGAELFEPFLEKPGNLLKVSRIYRDTRMHHDTPYKESLCIWIRRDVEWMAEHPCLFFEINPEGVDYGFCLWHPKPSTMARFRQYISRHPEPFLALIRGTEQTTGIPVTAECYKRPKPAPGKELEPYFAWKQDVSCIRHEDFGEDTFTPELSKTVGDFFQKVTPIYEYFTRFSEPSDL